ncbi:hypothetical protein [Neolewinella agarilytica]|uniref:Uncharacterized protein n=1 Tax=Neolewinella agarilytica TaxID=478744 RepID=A0A1H9CX12_9BACT|nr:hypothetical protein [Neolewinella agarilytica]SEQ05786.1 hypothetical protein SAMN05444359_10553 [Neolewinella agarilytica]
MEDKDPYDGEYIGNIFGWKISFIGLGVILLFSAVIAYRHYTMDVPLGFDDPLESEEEKARYAPAGAADQDTTFRQ